MSQDDVIKQSIADMRSSNRQRLGRQQLTDGIPEDGGAGRLVDTDWETEEHRTSPRNTLYVGTASLYCILCETHDQ